MKEREEEKLIDFPVPLAQLKYVQSREYQGRFLMGVMFRFIQSKEYSKHYILSGWIDDERAWSILQSNKEWNLSRLGKKSRCDRWW